MPNALIFYYGDIGYNFRLLLHAKSFCTLSESHVYLIGSDDHSLPKEIENTPNLSFMPIILFNPFPYLSFFFFPLRFILSLFQIFFICFSITSIDFIFCSTDNLLIDVICCNIASKFFNAKLIVDVSPFKWMNSNRLYKFILKIVETNQIKLADLIIVSTQAMQIILKVRKINSILIRDFPGTLFSSNKEIKRKENSQSNQFLISVPLNKSYKDNQQFSSYIEAAEKLLNDNHIKTKFLIFGSLKNQSFYNFSLKRNEAESVRNDNYVEYQFFPINSYQYSSLMQISDLAIIFEGSKYGLDLTSEIIQVASVNKPVIVYKYGCVLELFRNSKSAFFFENKDEFIKLFIKIFIQKEIDLHTLPTGHQNQFNWTETWNNSILIYIQKNTK